MCIRDRVNTALVFSILLFISWCHCSLTIVPRYVNLLTRSTGVWFTLSVQFVNLFLDKTFLLLTLMSRPYLRLLSVYWLTWRKLPKTRFSYKTCSSVWNDSPWLHPSPPLTTASKHLYSVALTALSAHPKNFLHHKWCPVVVSLVFLISPSQK